MFKVLAAMDLQHSHYTNVFTRTVTANGDGPCITFTTKDPVESLCSPLFTEPHIQMFPAYHPKTLQLVQLAAFKVSGTSGHVVSQGWSVIPLYKHGYGAPSPRPSHLAYPPTAHLKPTTAVVSQSADPALSLSPFFFSCHHVGFDL